MHAAAKAAVDAGYDVFSAHDVGERDEAIGYQFRMFDEVGGVHKLRPGLAMQQIRMEAQGRLTTRLQSWARDFKRVRVGDMVRFPAKIIQNVLH